jgi:hypothetical protein
MSVPVSEAVWLVGIFSVGAACAWSVLQVRGKPRFSSVLLVSAPWTGAWLVFGSSLTVWQETVSWNYLTASFTVSSWLWNAGFAAGAVASGIAGSFLIYRFLRA